MKSRGSSAGDPYSSRTHRSLSHTLGKWLRRIWARRVHYYRRRHSIAAERGPQPAKLVRIELSAESELTDRLTPATGAEIGTSPAGRGGTGYQPRHDPHRYARAMLTATWVTSPTDRRTRAGCGIVSTRLPCASFRSTHWSTKATASTGSCLKTKARSDPCHRRKNERS